MKGKETALHIFYRLDKPLLHFLSLIVLGQLGEKLISAPLFPWLCIVTREYWLTNSINISNAIPGDGYNLMDPVIEENQHGQKKKRCWFLPVPAPHHPLGGPVILWPNFLVHKIRGSHILLVHLPWCLEDQRKEWTESVVVNCKLPMEGRVVCVYPPQSPFTFTSQGHVWFVLFPY